MKSRLHYAARHGFTLTEIAIVLGIIGLMLGGIWTAASSARSNMQVDQASAQVLVIAQNIRSFYAGRSQISAALVGTEQTVMYENAGLFPPEMALRDTIDPNWGEMIRPSTPWGGYVSIHIMSATDFRVSYYNMTSAQCIPFIIAVSTSGTSSSISVGSWHQIPAQGNQPARGYATSSNQTLQNGVPFTVSQAANMCGSDTTGNTSAEFDFALQ